MIFRLLVAMHSLYNAANYGRYIVCFLSPGVSYPPVYMIHCKYLPREVTQQPKRNKLSACSLVFALRIRQHLEPKRCVHYIVDN